MPRLTRARSVHKPQRSALPWHDRFLYRSEEGRLAVKIPAILRHRSHRCDRLPPKKKVPEQKEELQRSATARSVTRAWTRGTRYAYQIGGTWRGETKRERKEPGEKGKGQKKEKNRNDKKTRTRRWFAKKEASKGTKERADEKLRERKKTETTALRPRYTSNMAAEGRIGGGQPRCRRRCDARASLTSTQTQRSSFLSAPTALLRLKRSPPTLLYSPPL